MASAERIAVTVAYSPAPREVDESVLSLEAGATLRQALVGSGLLTRHLALDLATLEAGIWGRLQGLDTPLRDGDRVEVYRPLQVDPKEARRQRQARQGLRPRLRR